MKTPMILVVDDEEMVREVIIEIIEFEGYATQNASSAEEALAILNSEQIALVVVDIVMPGMDGLELCRHIRASSQWAQMPVIVLSAKGSQGDIEEAMTAGASAYIRKPDGVLDIPQHIEQLLGKAPGDD